MTKTNNFQAFEFFDSDMEEAKHGEQHKEKWETILSLNKFPKFFEIGKR